MLDFTRRPSVGSAALIAATTGFPSINACITRVVTSVSASVCANLAAVFCVSTREQDDISALQHLAWIG